MFKRNKASVELRRDGTLAVHVRTVKDVLVMFSGMCVALESFGFETGELQRAIGNTMMKSSKRRPHDGSERRTDEGPA